MMPPELFKILGPYLKETFTTWRAASSPNHVAMVLQGSDEVVSLYALSVVDAQVALAEAAAGSDTMAQIALTLNQPPGDGRFWLVYMLGGYCGLLRFKWEHYVSRYFN